MIKNTQKLIVDFEHNDSIRQQNLFIHLANILNDFDGDPLRIEVVAYGPAIEMLINDGRDSDAIKKLQDRGVIFRGCHNAMKKHHLIETDLIRNVSVVSSGLSYIVKSQLEGAVYLKA